MFHHQSQWCFKIVFYRWFISNGWSPGVIFINISASCCDMSLLARDVWRLTFIMIQVKLWGLNSVCLQQELLDQSNRVEHKSCSFHAWIVPNLVLNSVKILFMMFVEKCLFLRCRTQFAEPKLLSKILGLNYLSGKFEWTNGKSYYSLWSQQRQMIQRQLRAMCNFVSLFYCCQVHLPLQSRSSRRQLLDWSQLLSLWSPLHHCSSSIPHCLKLADIR